MNKIKFSYIDNRSCKYYVEAEDKFGNIYKSNILKNEENYLESFHKLEADNIFSKEGNYDIKIEDNAGNKTEYTISIIR